MIVIRKTRESFQYAAADVHDVVPHAAVRRSVCPGRHTRSRRASVERRLSSSEPVGGRKSRPYTKQWRRDKYTCTRHYDIIITFYDERPSHVVLTTSTTHRQYTRLSGRPDEDASSKLRRADAIVCCVYNACKWHFDATAYTHDNNNIVITALTLGR